MPQKHHQSKILSLSIFPKSSKNSRDVTFPKSHEWHCFIMADDSCNEVPVALNQLQLPATECSFTHKIVGYSKDKESDCTRGTAWTVAKLVSATPYFVTCFPTTGKIMSSDIHSVELFLFRLFLLYLETGIIYNLLFLCPGALIKRCFQGQRQMQQKSQVSQAFLQRGNGK